MCASHAQMYVSQPMQGIMVLHLKTYYYDCLFTLCIGSYVVSVPHSHQMRHLHPHHNAARPSGSGPKDTAPSPSPNPSTTTIKCTCSNMEGTTTEPCVLCLLTSLGDDSDGEAEIEDEEATIEYKNRVAAEEEENRWQEALQEAEAGRSFQAKGAALGQEEGDDVLGVDHEGVEEGDSDDAAGRNPAEEPGSFAEYVQAQQDSLEHTYLVSLSDGTCTCPDRTVGGYICKHLFRALALSDHCFKSLPAHVRKAAHLSIDHDAIANDQASSRKIYECSSDDDDFLEDDMEYSSAEEADFSRGACQGAQHAATGVHPAGTPPLSASDEPSTSATTPGSNEEAEHGNEPESCSRKRQLESQMLMDTKNITSAVHNVGLWTVGDMERMALLIRQVRDECNAVAMRRNTDVDMQTADLPQRGRKRRRARHHTSTKVGALGSQATFDANKKARGRPKEGNGTDRLPPIHHGRVDWAKAASAPNIADA